MYDIALPESNEEELVIEYQRKKYKHVVFAYYVRDQKDFSIFEDLPFKLSRINVYFAAIVDADHPKKALSLAAELFYNKTLYNDLVFIVSKNFKFNKRILQRYYYNSILNPGYREVEDPLNARYIEIPTNLLKKLVDNKISICFSLRELENYKYLGRVLYLVKILNKKRIPILLGSFARNPKEVPRKEVIAAWLKLLRIKYTIKTLNNALFEQIRRTRLAKNPFVFYEGYEVVKFPGEDCREF